MPMTGRRKTNDCLLFPGKKNPYPAGWMDTAEGLAVASAYWFIIAWRGWARP
jgi:hypothetical protein